jgi:predicted PurR-regulated permease PerM
MADVKYTFLGEDPESLSKSPNLIRNILLLFSLVSVIILFIVLFYFIAYTQEINTARPVSQIDKGKVQSNPLNQTLINQGSPKTLSNDETPKSVTMITPNIIKKVYQNFEVFFNITGAYAINSTQFGRVKIPKGAKRGPWKEDDSSQQVSNHEMLNI